MFNDLAAFQTQVKLFKDHLGQKFLAGMIIGPRKGGFHRNISIDENTTEKELGLRVDENLYFVPQVCARYGDAADVKEIRTLFVDLDETEKPMDFLTVQPNLLMIRNDGRCYQAFFFLEEAITAKEFKKYQTILEIRYKSDAVKNANRLMRMAGVRRGDKPKDKKNMTPSGLHYEIASSHDKKMTVEDLKILIKENEENSNETQVTVEPGVNNIAEFPVFDDADSDTRIFPKELALFYDFFRGRVKKVGATSNTLYHFACELQDRGVPILEFKKYCDAEGVDVCAISHCEEWEFEHVAKSAPAHAQNVKKKKNLSRAAKNTGDPSKEENGYNPRLEELYETHTQLSLVREELNAFYFVEDEDVFYRENGNKTLTRVSKSVFTSTFRKYTAAVNKKTGKMRGVNPVDLFLSLENRSCFNVVSSRVYQPHSMRLVLEKGYKCLNSWSYPVFEEAKKPATLSIFLNHIKWIFEDQQSVTGLNLGEFFLDYLAYAYCNAKPANFCWLLVAPKVGIGRTFFTSLLQKLMGKDNVSAVSPRVAQDMYTNWYSKSQFAVVEEIKSDRGFYEQLKPYIANELVSHRQMHKDPTTVTNYCNLFILSNHIDCLKIDADDRRILAVHIHHDVKETSYYDELYNWKEQPENIILLEKFLRDRNTRVDRKTMLGHAPITSAKQLMQQINKSTSGQELLAHLKESSFGEELEFVDQKTLIESIHPNVLNAVIKERDKIGSQLSQLNYVPVFRSRQMYFGKNERVTIYVKSSFAKKHMADQEFKEVIKQYKLFKKIKLDAAEEGQIPVVQAEVIFPASVSYSENFGGAEFTQSPTEDNFKDSNSNWGTDHPGTSEPIHDKSSPKTKKIFALLEAAKKLNGLSEVKKLTTTADLIRIREEFCNRDNDVSFLFK